MASLPEPLLELLKAHPCELCQEQPIERRLLMEEDLSLADAVLRQLAEHRAHTPFFKVVARDPGDRERFLSIYDGTTRYELGLPAFDPVGGSTHFDSPPEAARAIRSYTALDMSADKLAVNAWLQLLSSKGDVSQKELALAQPLADVAETSPQLQAQLMQTSWPRAILLVRGEGAMRLRHGKILFDGITPLLELSTKKCYREALRAPWRL
ncbi:hypothetical protein AK812_SmicGene31865 [Symbiodinium microadriaticum]|uniref:Uncharacterized protein n=1 Tax=Symbiodinium microadriaticum TaxID=2951 RepID=A0A1Q9CVQ4_SYMMI|nr:hypothetical protein AK812_SmicGene31865 [Symbiodinium microadriaticum]